MGVQPKVSFDPFNTLNIQSLVGDKFKSIGIAVRMYEENTSSYVTDEIILQQNLVVNLILGEMRSKKVTSAPAACDIITNYLQICFDKSKELCIKAILEKLHAYKDIRTLYEMYVLNDRNVRTIYHKAPNRVQLIYKVSEIQRDFHTATKTILANPIEIPWNDYIDAYVKCSEKLDDLCESMAQVLEKLEKHGDDKRRMWVAIFALVFAVFIQMIIPTVRLVFMNDDPVSLPGDIGARKSKPDT